MSLSVSDGLFSRRRVALLVTAAALLSSTAALADDVDPAFRRPASAEEKARGDARARAMIEELGGAAAFGALRYVSFAFVPKKEGKVLSRREHAWNPGAGQARVRWQKDGADVTAFVRLADKSGVVRANGEPVTEDARRRELLQEAYAAWVNDVYWLISPYKAFDPGVFRADVGGRLRTSFEDGTGLTPGDVYLYDLDDDGRLSGWSFQLESGRTGRFRFEGRKQLAGVTFFESKVSTDGFEIALEDIEASASPRPEVFAPLNSAAP